MGLHAILTCSVQNIKQQMYILFPWNQNKIICVWVYKVYSNLWYIIKVCVCYLLCNLIYWIVKCFSNGVDKLFTQFNYFCGYNCTFTQNYHSCKGNTRIMYILTYILFNSFPYFIFKMQIYTIKYVYFISKKHTSLLWWQSKKHFKIFF